MDKSRIRKNLKRIQALKVWQLLILLVLTIFVAMTAIRMNNVEMIKRRTAVISADQELDDKKVQERLKELRDFSSAHMNANAVVQLEKIYARDIQQATQRATEKANSNPNGNIYKRASDICDPQFPGYSRGYQDCMMAEITKFSSGENPVDSIDFPEARLYVSRFTSPLWTPDLAGWTVLVAILIVFLIISKIIFEVILRLILRKHKTFI